MKAVVFSDSHGNASYLINALYDEKPDVCLFLGDGLRDLGEVRSLFPNLMIRAVCGNCDFGAMEAQTDEFVLGEKRIIMTHGHKYNVKLGYDSIVNMACCSGADILLFGHTHRQVSFDINGLTVMNPGSVDRGYYGVITITGGRVEAELKSM